MIRLRGHVNGNSVVLDEPLPKGISPNSPVEVTILPARDLALRSWNEFLRDWWQRPTSGSPSGRECKREELHERD